MRIKNLLKNYVTALVLGLSTCMTFGAAVTGQLWYGGQGPTSGTASGFTDDILGHINSDGSDPALVAYDPGSANCEIVGLDTVSNLYFSYWSDGTLRSGRMTGGQLASIKLADLGLDDEINAFAVDSTHHIVYVGLWGSDPSGADLIEVTYNPTNGQMVSPYNAATGKITNAAGVFLSETSTTNRFVLARQMWVQPGGNLIYYVDNDNGDPNDATLGGEQLNGVYVVSTTNSNPQPEQLSLTNQFPGDETNGYIVGLAVNVPQNLIYFATAGPSQGVDTASNAIWCMPITGGQATVMPMPEGVTLEYPNFYGGCLALDTAAQALYVSDEGQGTIVKLLLSNTGTNFIGGTSNFFTLDADHLNDGVNGFASAFTQGLEFVPTVLNAPAILNIMVQGPNVILSWPLADYLFELQNSPDLFSSDWTDYPGPVSVVGTNIVVTNAINGNPMEFYRLVQQ
jgi:hypothetical protein